MSAYARPGHRCQHNLNYWRFGDYLGIGAGAHGKLSFAHRMVRQVRYREPLGYMDRALAGQAVTQDDEVARADLPFEFMMNALRLTEGFALSLFNERTGLPLSTILPALEQAQTRGWVQRDGDWLRPTQSSIAASAVGMAVSLQSFRFQYFPLYIDKFVSTP